MTNTDCWIASNRVGKTDMQWFYALHKMTISASIRKEIPVKKQARELSYLTKCLRKLNDKYKT